VLAGRRPPDLARQAVTLLTGYLAGGVLSVLVASASGSGGLAEPVTLALLAEKPAYLGELVSRYLWRPLPYPGWLNLVRLALLVLPVAALAAASWRSAERRSERVEALLFLSAALLTPYLALMLVAESGRATRFLYLAPLVLGGAWTYALLLEWPRQARAIVLLLLPLLAVGSASASWQQGAGYVATFNDDLSFVPQVVARARAAGLRKVCTVQSGEASGSILRPGPPSEWRWPGTSAFFRHWSAPSFLDDFTDLEVDEDDASTAACASACRLPVSAPGFARTESLLCVCLP
jgi:hypothetical protein